MFRLAEARTSNRRLYCGIDGLFLGPVALIELRGGVYVRRPDGEVAALFDAVCDTRPDIGSLLIRLGAIADHLQQGRLAQAMISALLLGVDDLSEVVMARLLHEDAVLKRNFNPDEARDSHGRWTDEERSGSEQSNSGGSSSHRTDDGAGRERDLIPVSERSVSGTASYYNLPGRLMANGRIFNPGAMTAAMLGVPLRTIVTVRLAEDRSRSITVTVTDRGPYAGGRIIDLTPAAFKALAGSLRSGLINVVVKLP